MTVFFQRHANNTHKRTHPRRESASERERHKGSGSLSNSSVKIHHTQKTLHVAQLAGKLCVSVGASTCVCVCVFVHPNENRVKCSTDPFMLCALTL